MSEKVRLGARVKDIVSGFEGIAVARCEHLDGGVNIGVKASISAGDTEMPKAEYIPEVQLQVVDDGIHVAPIERSIGFDRKEAV